MALEFTCGECKKILRVAESAAGKQARCPGCGTVTVVPATTMPPPPGATPYDPFGGQRPEAARGAPVNPFQSPQSSDPTSWAATGGHLRPTPIDIGIIFSRSWSVFSANVGKCLIVGICACVIYFAVGFGGGLMQAMIRDRATRSIVSLGFSLLVQFPINIWLQCGIIAFCLRLVRGQDADVNDIFSGGSVLFEAMGATIVFMIIYALGLLLFIVPGIIAALMMSQYMVLIVDRRLGAIDALKVSREITYGNRMTLFGLYLIAGLAGGLATLCTCLTGIIAVIPFMIIMQTVTYLTMSGQLDSPDLNEPMPSLTPLQ